jgi:hypothetical protein
VGIIAEKTPEMHGGPNVYHGELCIANLLGYPIPMTGQIPMGGDRPVKTDGKTGIVYDASPESKAFSRWQNGKFLEVERLFARVWRDSLNNVDLKAIAETMRVLGIDSKTCKSLQNARAVADAVVNAKDKPFDRIKLTFLFLNVPREFHRPILERWSIDGYRPLSTYAPYTAYVLTVELFFQIALAANLIATERPSNRVDIAYLFYLPFCMVFI